MRALLSTIVICLLCAVGGLVAYGWMVAALITGAARGPRIAVGFDQTANAAFGGAEDETISARSWRYRERQPYTALRRLIDSMFELIAGQSNHCEQQFLKERARRANG